MFNADVEESDDKPVHEVRRDTTGLERGSSQNGVLVILENDKRVFYSVDI